MSSEQWVSCAELARRCGLSRNAVKKSIQERRINPSDVRRVGRSVLVRLDAGLAVLGYRAPAPAAPTRPTTTVPSLFAWGTSAAPEPEPAPQPEPSPSPDEPDDSAAALAAVEQWASAYSTLRKWLMWGASSGYSGEMWAALGDGPLDIGTVMVTSGQLIGAQLAELDRLATKHACRQRPNEWRTWR